MRIMLTISHILMQISYLPQTSSSPMPRGHRKMRITENWKLKILTCRCQAYNCLTVKRTNKFEATSASHVRPPHSHALSQIFQVRSTQFHIPWRANNSHYPHTSHTALMAGNKLRRTAKNWKLSENSQSTKKNTTVHFHTAHFNQRLDQTTTSKA